MKAFITGGSGFIGSSIVDRLLEMGHDVIAYDNLSTGQELFLEKAESFQRFNFIRGDTLDEAMLTESMVESALLIQ